MNLNGRKKENEQDTEESGKPVPSRVDRDSKGLWACGIQLKRDSFLRQPNGQPQRVDLQTHHLQAGSADGSTYIVRFGKEAVSIYSSATEHHERQF
jgi:hypothetical protein